MPGVPPAGTQPWVPASAGKTRGPAGQRSAWGFALAAARCWWKAVSDPSASLGMTDAACRLGVVDAGRAPPPPLAP